MNHKFFSHFYWFALWFMLLHSQSSKLLSLAASPWPESRELDAASRVPCGGIAHHPTATVLALESNDPRSNLEMPSLDTAVQSLPIRDATVDAKMCATEEAAICGVKLSEDSPSLCENGMDTVLLKASKRPDSGKACDSHNSILQEAMQAQNILRLPEQACHFNPAPATTSVQLDHGHAPSTPIGHDAGIFDAELRKGRKPPAVGQPSPIHNSIPDSETLTRIDVSLKFQGVGLFYEPASGGHGQELAAKNGHSGDSFVKIGDSGDLQNILVRNSGRQGAGSPSTGHNSVADGVASE